MPETLKVRKVGNSLGTLLPKHLTDEMHIGEGDELYVTRTPEGFMISPYDPDFEEAIGAARRFMDNHRDALKELAK